MRNAFFFIIILVIVTYVVSLTHTGKGADGTSANDTAITDTMDFWGIGTYKDSSTIASTCKVFENIHWTEEDIKKMETPETIEGHIVHTHPWILIRGAERNLDTVVNRYHITFTTEE